MYNCRTMGSAPKCEQCREPATKLCQMTTHQCEPMPICDDCAANHDAISSEINDHEMRHFGGAYGQVTYHYLPLPPAPGTQPATEHSDDLAVDRFAEAMKTKLAGARQKGRSGWDDPDQCSLEFLASLLIGHVRKGNAGNFEDIANLCMMLHQRGADPSILAATEQPSVKEAARDAVIHEADFLLDRLKQYEADGCQCSRSVREWCGHVSPPMARLEAALRALKGGE